MNATSTHDTKRSEDVRARILVLADMPAVWEEALRRWHAHAGPFGIEAVGRKAEVLLYQTLLGAWPVADVRPSEEASGEPVPREFAERIRAYMLKAVREAGEETGWRDPDEGYEGALARVIRGLLVGEGGAPFRRDVRRVLGAVAPLGALVSLAQGVVKGAAPGVPDVYEGTELWDDSLVDPDNRRPVDFAMRGRLLDAIVEREKVDRAGLARELLGRWTDGAVKLYVTYRLLGLRRRWPDALARGEYVPLAAARGANRHLLAFARRGGRRWVIVAVPRLMGRYLTEAGHQEAPFDLGAYAALAAEAVGGAHVSLPAGAPARWSHLFTGDERVLGRAGVQRGGGRHVAAAELFAGFPVAVWVAEGP